MVDEVVIEDVLFFVEVVVECIGEVVVVFCECFYLFCVFVWVCKNVDGVVEVGMILLCCMLVC